MEAGLQRPAHAVPVVDLGEEEQFDRGAHVQEPPADLYATHVRKVEVHEDEIRCRGTCDRDGLPALSGQADDVDAIPIEDVLQPGSDELAALHDEDPDACRPVRCPDAHDLLPAASVTMPPWMAKAAASSLECTPSFARTCWMWVRTVSGLMTRAWAMVSLFPPSAKSASTWRSLRERLERRLVASSWKRRRRIRRLSRSPSIAGGTNVSPSWTALAAAMTSERAQSLVR